MTRFFASRRVGWRVTGEADAPRLENETQKKAYAISREEAYAFSSCDGRSDFFSPAFLPAHRAALSRLIRLGAARRCPLGFSGEKPAIGGALWAVTGRCNLRCRHCYMEAPQGKCELPLEEMERILDALCEAGATRLELTGGEPLMRRDLFDLLEGIAERGIQVTDVFTNATLVTEAFLSQMRDTGLAPRFRVSFDGVGAHDKMRGVPGAEERALSGVRALLGAGFRVTVTTSVDENTLPTLSKTYEVMRELGVHAWGLGRPQAAGCARNMIRVDDSAFCAACEALLARWQADGKPFTLGLESLYSEAVSDDMRHDTPPFSPALYACESCRAYPHITCEGDLLPCPCFAETEYGGAFGNLAREGWRGAWENPALRRAMDVTKADVLRQNPACASCEHLPLCRTGCRVSALLGGAGLLGRDESTCRLFTSGMKARFAALGDKT